MCTSIQVKEIRCIEASKLLMALHLRHNQMLWWHLQIPSDQNNAISLKRETEAKETFLAYTTESKEITFRSLEQGFEQM